MTGGKSDHLCQGGNSIRQEKYQADPDTAKEIITKFHVNIYIHTSKIYKELI